MSSDGDPRVASKRVEFPAKAKKEETDPMGDGYLSMSTVASSVGLFMRVRRERVYGRGARPSPPDPDPPFSTPPPLTSPPRRSNATSATRAWGSA
jgi:hypothetical protein